MRPLFKSEDEPRDEHGKWTAEMEHRGVPLHGTSGILGLNRGGVMNKIRNILDAVIGIEGGPRAAKYVGGLIGGVLGSVPGTPPEIMEQAISHGAHLAEHLKEATGTVVGKVIEHPAYRRLAAKVVLRKDDQVTKSLEGDDESRLKDIVAGAMADTRLSPHVSYSDAALAAVAHGSYRHCRDRLCALRDAASN